jgi:hypothetical protein
MTASWISVGDDWLTTLLRLSEPVNPDFAHASTVHFMRALSLLADAAVQDPQHFLQTTMGPILARVQPLWSEAKPDEARLGIILEQTYRASDLGNALDIAASYTPAGRHHSAMLACIAAWYYAIYSLSRAVLLARGVNSPEHHTGVAHSMVNQAILRLMPDPFSVLARQTKGMECELNPVGYPRNSKLLNVTGPATLNDAEAVVGAYLAGCWGFYAEAVVAEIKREYKATRLTPALQKVRDQRVFDVGFLHSAFRYRGKAHYRDGIYTSYGHSFAQSNTFLHDCVRSYQHFSLIAESIVCRSVQKKWYRRYIEDVGARQRDNQALFPTRWQGPAILAVV